MESATTIMPPTIVPEGPEYEIRQHFINEGGEVCPDTKTTVVKS